MTFLRPVCLAAMASLSVVAAPGAATRSVVIRAYNTYGLSARNVSTASHTVRGLLSSVGIEARWRNCRIVGRPADLDADPCTDPLAPNEVIVRLLGGVTLPSGSDSTLGYSYVDPVRKNGSLATIDVGRVVDLSSALHVDRGTMLGRAIAHEIGHLLRGTQAHSVFGLMRKKWSASAIMENRPADWIYTREQGLEMQSGLEARLIVRQ